MGLDTTIVIELAPGYVKGDISSPYNHWPEPFDDDSGRSLWQLYDGSRYYCERYARGYWPTICAALLTVMQQRCVRNVWYITDCQETLGEPLTLERISELNKFWVEWGNLPYDLPCSEWPEELRKVVALSLKKKDVT